MRLQVGLLESAMRATWVGTFEHAEGRDERQSGLLYGMETIEAYSLLLF